MRVQTAGGRVWRRVRLGLRGGGRCLAGERELCPPPSPSMSRPLQADPPENFTHKLLSHCNNCRNNSCKISAAASAWAGWGGRGGGPSTAGVSRPDAGANGTPRHTYSLSLGSPLPPSSLFFLSFSPSLFVPQCSLALAWHLPPGRPSRHRRGRRASSWPLSLDQPIKLVPLKLILPNPFISFDVTHLLLPS